MKRVIIISMLVISSVLLFMASCEKYKNKLPVDFKFVLLDTLGNEKTVFKQGENIIFSFQVINHSSEDLYLENFLPNDDFFRVYQANTDEGTDYGIPYDYICEIGALTIPANDTLKINCTWVISKNNNYFYSCLSADTVLHETFLPIGNYYTEFSQSFKIGDIQTKEKHFKINFTIQ